MIRTLQKIRLVKTQDIIPNPYQTRKNFDEKKLGSLALSIKEVGILSPVILRRANKGYEIVCGQRRVRAAAIAGMEEVPAIIITAGDAQCASLSVIENMHRENLDFFEEAESYYNLMVYHKIKKERLLKKLSADPFILNEKIRLLALPESVRTRIEVSLLDEKITKQLLRLRNEEKQLEITEKAIKEGLSEKDVRQLVDNYIKDTVTRNAEKTKKEQRLYDCKEKAPLFINTVKKTVDLLKRSGAQVVYEEKETEKYLEFTIKTLK